VSETYFLFLRLCGKSFLQYYFLTYRFTSALEELILRNYLGRIEVLENKHSIWIFTVRFYGVLRGELLSAGFPWPIPSPSGSFFFWSMSAPGYPISNTCCRGRLDVFKAPNVFYFSCAQILTRPKSTKIWLEPLGYDLRLYFVRLPPFCFPIV
jgi:hypothetical protein